MNFFILGLPRSRTAWMSAWLTAMGLICYHEGINGCMNLKDYQEKLGKDKGDSSTASFLFDLDALFPGHKRIIIDGDLQRAIDFSYKTYGVHLADFLMHCDSMLKNLTGLHIPIKELDFNLHMIWNHLTEKPFNQVITDNFTRFNIQIKDPYDFNIEAIHALFKEGRCLLLQ